MSDEKKLILEMLSEGKITVIEAEKLLDSTSEATDISLLPKSVNKKFLKVLIKEGNVTKVNINIPIALAEVGLKLIPKDRLVNEGRDINWDDVTKLIEEGTEGELVNIDTISDGKEVLVKILIE